MERFVINGGNKLNGEIEVPCAKNSYLAILAGCVLSSGVVLLHKCPNFNDIQKMLEILTNIGCVVKKEGEDVIIDCSGVNNYVVPSNLASVVRSSIFLLGPIVARLKRAQVAYPGGCDIGARPIDLHLMGLRKLNVEIDEKYGIIECVANNMRGDYIHLDYPSVGATENIMMAAVLAKGKTVIFNAAKEPEVVDLQNFINSMGGKISGAGTSTITIYGVVILGCCVFCGLRDRIIAGTYLIAGACCGGNLLIKNVDFEHIYSLITKFNNSSCKIRLLNDKINIVSEGRHKSFGNIETMPYPGFPTDLQAQTLVLQAISKGTSIITENLFETRFKHVPELIKMGANITLKNKMAIVTGVEKLYGAEINSHDLRAGAALTIAGLVANGTTILNDVKHIDRGYDHLELSLNSLGADIKREKVWRKSD